MAEFYLKSPCLHCPFRADKTRCVLRAQRAKAIAKSLLSGEMFPCHETVNHSRRNRKKEKHCAGALIILEREKKPNEFMQVFARLGYYATDKMKLTTPVFKTMAEFVKANRY
jgi:hypothetical protein